MHEDTRTARRCTRHFADISYSLLGIPAEELGGISHLAARVRQGLAVFQRDQFGETLGIAHDQFVSLAQDLGSLARLAPRPTLESALRRIEPTLCVVARRAPRP